MPDDHLYTHGGKKRNLHKFEERYGEERGAEIYGKVVGKVRRERMAKGLCQAGNCGLRTKHSHGGTECCGKPLHCAAILGMEQNSGNPAFGATPGDYLR